MGPDEVHDAELQSVWLALDADLSGFVDSGEFGVFMRKGEPPVEKVPNLRRRLDHGKLLRAECNDMEAAKMMKEIDQLRVRTSRYNAATLRMQAEHAECERPAMDLECGALFPELPSPPREGSRSVRIPAGKTPIANTVQLPSSPRTRPPRVATLRDEQRVWRKTDNFGLPRSMYKPVLLKDGASGGAAEAVRYKLDLPKRFPRPGNWQ